MLRILAPRALPESCKGKMISKPHNKVSICMLYTYIYVSRCNLQCLEWLLRALGTRIYNQLTTHQSQTRKNNEEIYRKNKHSVHIYGIWYIYKGSVEGYTYMHDGWGSVCTRDRASGKHEKRERERDSEKTKDTIQLKSDE